MGMEGFGRMMNYNRKYMSGWRDSVDTVLTSFRLAQLLKGEVGEEMRVKVWEEIVEALRKDIPDIDGIVERARE